MKLNTFLLAGILLAAAPVLAETMLPLPASVTSRIKSLPVTSIDGQAGSVLVGSGTSLAPTEMWAGRLFAFASKVGTWQCQVYDPSINAIGLPHLCKPEELQALSRRCVIFHSTPPEVGSMELQECQPQIGYYSGGR